MRRLLGFGVLIVVLLVGFAVVSPAVAPSLGSLAPSSRPATQAQPSGTAIKIVVNGKEIITDVDPVIVNGRAMVPVRFVVEALGAQVSWSEAERTVTIEAGAAQGASAALRRLWAWIKTSSSSLVGMVQQWIGN